MRRLHQMSRIFGERAVMSRSGQISRSGLGEFTSGRGKCSHIYNRVAERDACALTKECSD